ncbi:MAG: hypothetical protein L6R39_007155 [Caloplaca ligustica]|nr:MAG: hypothetical protein L6R39_007155 [Caloplaca ligustica]
MNRSSSDDLVTMDGQRPDAVARDEDKLAELGYRQDLRRDWSMLHNFGVSFSIISVITGLTTYHAHQCPLNPLNSHTDSSNMDSTPADLA